MSTLEQIGAVFGYILPVLGAILLVLLIVLVIKILKIVTGLQSTVTTANKALDTVNGYIGEMNTTVRTVNNVSMSVESVRVALTSLVKKAIAKWTDEYQTIKQLLTTILEKVTKTSPATPTKEAETVVAAESEEKVEGEVKLVNPDKEA